ncbi:MAG: PTS sugar transporter subunit IIA [Chromatiales bacterium]|nr:PTS sugar transporter subunit IIA [Chromatiales bacterium]
MNFSDYLVLDRIKWVDSATKKKSLVMLSEMACRSTPLDPHTVLSHLFEREQLGSTAIGKGIAIPHCRIKDLSNPIVALLRVRQGIDYDAPDQLPVKLIFALLLPENANQQHLDLLASLARHFSDSARVQELLSAKDEASLLHKLKGVV